MIALGPIIGLLIQFGPAVLTLLSQIIAAWQGVPAVGAEHPVASTVAALVAGALLPSPIRRK